MATLAAWLTRLAVPAIAACCWPLAGCPSGMCLVKVCKGNPPSCSCSWSTCPSGASFDTNRNNCVCQTGRVSIGGSCLTLAEANEYCGKASHYERYGCVRTVCPAGQEISQETGQCLAKQQVDQVAQNMGVQIGQNQKLGCPTGLVLVVEGPNGASCVPPSAACSRDEVWNGKACAKTQACPPGSIFDASRNACIAYSAGEDNKEYTSDLNQWTLSSYGPDGGSGAPAFCTGFNGKPLAFGVLPGGSIRVRVAITVQAPEKQIAQAQVTTAGVVDATGAPVTAKGAAEIQKAAQDILSALVRQGGKANQPSAGTRVNCLITNAAAPTAVPATGGA
jgi:hypothetical protein